MVLTLDLPCAAGDIITNDAPLAGVLQEKEATPVESVTLSCVLCPSQPMGPKDASDHRAFRGFGAKAGMLLEHRLADIKNSGLTRRNLRIHRKVSC